MPPPTTERLTEQLRELRLPAFRDHFQSQAERAAQENLSYPQYLEALTSRECEARTQGRIRRLATASRLPQRQDLGPVPVVALAEDGAATVPDPARRRLPGSPRERAWCLASPVRERRTPCVRVGRATGVCRGDPVLFATCSLLVQELLAAKRDLQAGTLPEEAGRLRGADHRRPRLRATEPRGDGGAVHAVGGALRTRQRAADQQPAVLAVGRRSSRTR